MGFNSAFKGLKPYNSLSTYVKTRCFSRVHAVCPDGDINHANVREFMNNAINLEICSAILSIFLQSSGPVIKLL